MAISGIKAICPLCGSKNTDTNRKAFPAYGQQFMDYWIIVVKCKDCHREWSQAPPSIAKESYNKTKIEKMVRKEVNE